MNYQNQSNMSEALVQSLEESKKMNVSAIFPDIVLSKINKNIEGYLIETSVNTVENNEDIIGVGVLFEPFAFLTNYYKII